MFLQHGHGSLKQPTGGEKFRVLHCPSNNPKFFEARKGYYLCTESSTTFEAVGPRDGMDRIVNGCGDRKWFVPSTRSELIQAFNKINVSGLHQPIRYGLTESTASVNGPERRTTRKLF